MKTPILALALVAFLSGLLPGPAHAQVLITYWDFNSVPPDGKTTTGTLVPRVGSGSATGFGGVSAGFSDGAGSTDPARSDNSGLSLASFPSQRTGSGTRGAQFRVPTVGYSGISVSWDQRFSSTASRAYEFQYTVDGAAFTPLTTLLNTAGGNAWMLGNSVDLSGIAGVADNPDFGFRIVSVFEPGTSAYGASAPGSTYSTSGTWRFDEVTVKGTAMPAVIPEPHEYALMAGGMLLGFAACRRHRARANRA